MRKITRNTFALFLLAVCFILFVIIHKLPLPVIKSAQAACQFPKSQGYFCKYYSEPDLKPGGEIRLKSIIGSNAVFACPQGSYCGDDPSDNSCVNCVKANLPTCAEKYKSPANSTTSCTTARDCNALGGTAQDASGTSCDGKVATAVCCTVDTAQACKVLNKGGASGIPRLSCQAKYETRGKFSRIQCMYQAECGVKGGVELSAADTYCNDGVEGGPQACCGFETSARLTNSQSTLGCSSKEFDTKNSWCFGLGGMYPDGSPIAVLDPNTCNVCNCVGTDGTIASQIPVYGKESCAGSKVARTLREKLKALDKISAQGNATNTEAAILDVINTLQQEFPEYKDTYNYGPVVKEGYSLKAHTAHVMRQFERYFEQNFNDFVPDSVMSKELFRIMLLLHDAGKPDSIKAAIAAGYRGDDALRVGSQNQHTYTAQIIPKIMSELDFSKQEINIILSVATQDLVGGYVKGLAGRSDSISYEEAINSISKRASALGIDRSYFNALAVYYLSDASAYTRDGGGVYGLDDLFKFQRGNTAAKGKLYPLANAKQGIQDLAGYFMTRTMVRYLTSASLTMLTSDLLSPIFYYNSSFPSGRGSNANSDNQARSAIQGEIDWLIRNGATQANFDAADRYNRDRAKQRAGKNPIIGNDYIHVLPAQYAFYSQFGTLAGELWSGRSHANVIPLATYFSLLWSTYDTSRTTPEGAIRATYSRKYWDDSYRGITDSPVAFVIKRSPSFDGRKIDITRQLQQNGINVGYSFVFAAPIGNYPTDIVAAIVRDNRAINYVKTIMKRFQFYVPVYDAQGNLRFSEDEYDKAQ